MKARVLQLTELEGAARGRWRELAAAASEPNPFYEPEFAVPAAERIEGFAGLLVSVAEDGDWVAAMPIWSGRGWHGVPLRATTGWFHLYSFYGAPLLRRGVEAEALVPWFSKGAPTGAFLGFDQIDAGGPARAAIAAAAAETRSRVTVFKESDRAALYRCEDGMSLRLTSKRRRENARLGRRLGEHLGEELRVVDRTDDAAAIDTFLELEASGWKGEEGTALASDPAHAEFFRRMCDGAREAGRLRFLALEAGDTVAAIKCNLLAGGVYFCFKTAFDESLAEFSPGVQLERALVDEEADNLQTELIDTCADSRNEMANRVWPDRRPLVTLAVSGRGPGATLSRLAVRASAQTRKTIRRAP